MAQVLKGSSKVIKLVKWVVQIATLKLRALHCIPSRPALPPLVMTVCCFTIRADTQAIRLFENFQIDCDFPGAKKSEEQVVDINHKDTLQAEHQKKNHEMRQIKKDKLWERFFTSSRFRWSVHPPA